MRKPVALFSAVVSLLVATLAGATADGLHQNLTCTSCHVTEPVVGQPVTYVGGDKENLCSQCHSSGSTTTAPAAFSLMAVETVQPATVVNKHTSYATIPEQMKQQMIQWLSDRGLPLLGAPTAEWSIGCTTCHSMHGAKYPMLLNYGMEQGELCQLCHGGTINTATDWTKTTARRVLYAPSHSGQLADGTEIQAPLAPKNGDTVSSTVNFPLAVFSGFHQTIPDVAYKISIPGSVFGTRDVNPSNHMYWYFDADMTTWDTTAEANGAYTVDIIPYTPSTMVEATPVTFSVNVNNMTMADKICTMEAKFRSASIDNEGIRNSLASKAANACNAAQRGNMNASRGILEALINQLEAQKGQHVEQESANGLIASVNDLLALF